MTEDIVPALRRLAPYTDVETERVMQTAADEIERLRKEVESAYQRGIDDASELENTGPR